MSAELAAAFVDVASLGLEDTGPPGTVLQGQPMTACMVLHEDAGLEVGVWSVTPGVFASRKVGVSESMYFLSGAGSIEHPDGSATTIAPGTLLHLHDGWQGTWHVTQTVRKTYVIVTTRGTLEDDRAG